ncbi:ribonuclease J [Jatrophihabitans endophyticus]|uniref:Ribonuclease J n=1 Tax=Jatrophihabitans endophyticus TaxID=1206085 RepID=A0A1M5IJD5_9ACTN|nr:ribonuclease J [Jatrophihabitans endophyticus]SHG28412.1 ribonuclease J [Jatrophihabitans endophyticus]
MSKGGTSGLGDPPALPAGGLRLVALGGIKEIGRNMTVFEFDGRLLVVDCGMLLGKTNSPGVDITLPDWSHFADRLDDIDAVVLTHGHEDHIGALPYLLRDRPDIPVVGSRLTLALVSAKLEQRQLKVERQLVAEGDSLQVGPWGLRFFAVNHSIPDALAVAIRAGGQTVLHTGDFKMDQTPLDNRLTDLPGFSRLGDEGVDLLLSDSTNAEVPGFIPSEREVGKVVTDVIHKAQGRIIVACFASHVHRVQQVLDAAHASDRQVAFVGRSMVRNMGIARDLGLLRIPDGLVVDLKLAEELPSRRILLISTGSQGEPLSALSRMANRDHQTVTISSDDTILLASSLIPGNETSVGQVINGLSRLGATVVHKSTALVHVSGHAPAGELRYLIAAVRPTNLMPVHGEWRHLRAHAAIGRSMGLPDERIMLAEDGTVVDLVDGRASITGKIPVGYVYVDGLEVGDIGDSTLKDRRILGEDGFLSILVAVDLDAGKVVFGPEITARGFSDDPAALDPITAELVEVVEKALADGTRDADALQHLIRRTVGRWVDRQYRRRPMLMPQVVEV